MLKEMRIMLTGIGRQIASHQAAPIPLQRYWQQEPVTFEDALGRESPVHLELIDSWEVSLISVNLSPKPFSTKHYPFFLDF
jgi:hypothetical protein